MLSLDTKIVLATTPVAIALLSLFAGVLDAPSWLSMAVLLGVGVVLPQLLSDYLDARAGGDAL